MEEHMRTLYIPLVLSLAAAPAIAHEGHHAKRQAEGKLTGEVVDITCYLDHDSQGEKHSSCAQKCIEKGMPVGLVADGKLYLVIVSSHESPNLKLAPWAGKMVTIKGARTERDGMRAIDMEDVQPVATETR
jgi:hypothetical protein